MKSLGLLLGLGLAAWSGSTAMAHQDERGEGENPGKPMQPYVATYAAEFRGIAGGALRMELRKDAASGHYEFETRPRPTALASFFVSRDAFDRTTLEVTAAGLRPLAWEADDARSGVKNDGKLQFNWQEHSVSGTFEGKPVSLPLAPGTMTLQAIQLVAMAKMLRGQEPGPIDVVNGNKLQQYSYKRVRAETVDTRLGKLETIVYESARQDSSRAQLIWHAPALGHVPVRAEQVRKGKVETVLTLVALERP